MNMRPPSFRLSLLVSVASVMLLTACGPNRFTDMFSAAPGRKEQHVDGPRRHPTLNPCFRTGPTAEPTPPCISDGQELVQQSAPPAPQANPQAHAPVENAFDQYDARGNKIAAGNEPPKPIEMPDAQDENKEEAAVGSSFFDRFFTKRAEQAPADASNDGVRKPFADSVTSSTAKSEPVSSAPVPQAEFKPLIDEEPKAAASGFVPVTSVVEEPKAASVEEAKQEMAVQEQPSSRPSFFSRLMSPFKKIRTDDAPAAKDEPVNNSYPSLSSVPATPDEFKAVKLQKDEKIEELQMDHALAQEDKQALDAEPSQTQPVAPVAPLVMEQKPAPVAVTQGDEPKLLGHISDSNLANVPPASEPVVQAPPAPVEMAAPQEEKQPEPERKPWWKRWSITGNKDEAAQPESAPTQPVAETPQPLLATVPEFKPVEPQTQAPAPVVQMPDNTPADADSTQTTDTGSLPDPDALKKVKALPPSRYQTRARDRQYYLVP